uniref:Uncharacterized protein n=1 Tax=Spongospora subterranea TaxID=70186 RepID=A0A0H5QER9_9EUKA|eukprot:CRZ00548.1 hypothetical protein [Spongospora subterranea]
MVEKFTANDTRLGDLDGRYCSVQGRWLIRQIWVTKRLSCSSAIDGIALFSFVIDFMAKDQCQTVLMSRVCSLTSTFSSTWFNEYPESFSFGLLQEPPCIAYYKLDIVARPSTTFARAIKGENNRMTTR